MDKKLNRIFDREQKARKQARDEASDPSTDLADFARSVERKKLKVGFENVEEVVPDDEEPMCSLSRGPLYMETITIAQASKLKPH